MKRFFIAFSVSVIFALSFGCQSKKAQSSENIEVKEPKVYKDGYELKFIASGHSPEWKVEIYENTITYTNVDFPEPMVFKLLRTTHIMDVEGFGFTGKNTNGEEVFVQVLKEECEDVSTNKKYPFNADVSIANIKNMGQRGCGEFIEDERLNKKWFLETFKGKEINKNLNGTRPEIKFNTNKNMFSANMGCNGINGGYLVMENSIHFNNGFASTLMHCDGIMDLERNFTSVIKGSVMIYSFKGSTLIFKNYNGLELMTFRMK